MAAAASALLALALWGLLGQVRMEREVQRLEGDRERLRRQVEVLSREVGTHAHRGGAGEAGRSRCSPGRESRR